MKQREPAPRDRAYAGIRAAGQSGAGTVTRVELNGARSPLDLRLDLYNHSPDGFQWGYHGSGPAQLALALVADATGDDQLALKVYQKFKREIVGTLPDRWQLDAGNIADFAKSLAHMPADQL